MSKWNVKTADGRIADVKQVAQPVARTDLEAANPKFTGTATSSPLLADFADIDKHPTCMKNLGTWLETRRGKACAISCLCFIIIFAILAAILIPRFPQVIIDRAETAQSIKLQNFGNGTTRVFGNVTMLVVNPNVYPIEMAGMDINGTIGRNQTNQLHYSQSVGELFIPGNQGSKHILPLDFTIPPELDAVALALEIAKDCLDNSMTSLMQGRAQVKFLGSIIPFSFGPQEFESRCIGN